MAGLIASAALYEVSLSAAPAEGLLRVPDREPDEFLVRLERRRLLEGLERPLLLQQARGHCGLGDPGLRILRFDQQQSTRRLLGLLHAPQRDQRRPESPQRERYVRGLLERMSQQAFGIPGLVGRQREGREADQRGHVARVSLQDGSEELLGFPAIIGHERRGRLLHAHTFRIREARALEGDARVVVLLQVEERIAIGQPGAMVVRIGLEHPPHLLACLCRAARRADRRARDPRARGRNPARARTRAPASRCSPRGGPGRGAPRQGATDSSPRPGPVPGARAASARRSRRARSAGPRAPAGAPPRMWLAVSVRSRRKEA